MRKPRKIEIKYSFTQWCRDNDRQDILDRWDYDLNELSPDEVSYKSNKKYWFKCPKGIHDSELKDVQYLAAGRLKDLYCDKCRSFAQHIINDYGEEYFNKIWNKDNVIDPWKIPYKSMKKALFNCLNNSGHVYEKTLQNFISGQRCTYCSHKSNKGICIEETLGSLYPEVFDVWSNKNEKTPYDYYPGSGVKAWFKCKDGKHEDYQQQIAFAVKVRFRCPECVRNMFTMPYYCEDFRIDPQRRKLQKKARNAAKSNQWRKDVLVKCDHTCQCCGGQTDFRMNVHHIEGFADNEDLRCDINNGIALCDDCHNVIKQGSFHNIYGTINNTPEQLEEYINNKRKQLGINEEFKLINYKAGKILKPID